MQHGTLLTVNLCLILLLNYGQTDDICGAGKIRRGDKCCLSQLCVDTGFAECTVSNTKDNCVPCSNGFYLIGQYETSNFPDPNVCAAIKECSPEEVKNQDGECVCDVSRGYYHIDEGICGLVQIPCTPAGRQLSLHGHCDPCPEGYFKPVSGKQRCINKSNITCSSTEMILEGNTTTDRKCVKNDNIMSTSTYSPPLSTYSNITNDDIDRNGNNVLWKWLLIGGVGLFIIVVVILLIRYYHRRQQLQDLENHERAEYVPLQPLNGALPIVDDDNIDNSLTNVKVPYQSPRDNIPNDDNNFDRIHTYEVLRYQYPLDNIANDDDNIVNSHTNVKVPYQSPQDNIPNDDDNFDNSHTNVKVPYQSSQDNIPNDDDNFENEVDPYQLPQDNIPNAVRGEMRSRDEDNSNQKDRSCSPLLGRSCLGAVGGDIDGKDTASSINNDNDVQNVKQFNCQPSEDNLQQARMVLGLDSCDAPFQNPDANLPHPLPHYHSGYSDEDDSGFH